MKYLVNGKCEHPGFWFSRTLDYCPVCEDMEMQDYCTKCGESIHVITAEEKAEE